MQRNSAASTAALDSRTLLHCPAGYRPQAAGSPGFMAAGSTAGTRRALGTSAASRSPTAACILQQTYSSSPAGRRVGGLHCRPRPSIVLQRGLCLPATVAARLPSCLLLLLLAPAASTSPVPAPGWPLPTQPQPRLPEHQAPLHIQCRRAHQEACPGRLVPQAGQRGNQAAQGVPGDEHGRRGGSGRGEAAAHVGGGVLAERLKLIHLRGGWQPDSNQAQQAGKQLAAGGAGCSSRAYAESFNCVLFSSACPPHPSRQAGRLLAGRQAGRQHPPTRRTSRRMRGAPRSCRAPPRRRCTQQCRHQQSGRRLQQHRERQVRRWVGGQGHSAGRAGLALVPLLAACREPTHPWHATDASSSGSGCGCGSRSGGSRGAHSLCSGQCARRLRGGSRGWRWEWRWWRHPAGR